MWIPTPEGFEAQVRPRSGLSLKHGLIILNSPGTIDSDYRGELKVELKNLSSVPYKINCGDRIAQMVILSLADVHIEVAEEVEDTSRNSCGFGSTGD